MPSSRKALSGHSVCGCSSPQPCAGDAARTAAAALPSASSQATTTAKQGFRNSEGCMVPSSGKASQRRAPLVSKPMTRVAAVSASAPMQPRMARCRMLRGVSSETITISAAASGEEHHLLGEEQYRASVPMRSATAGLAASIMT